MKYKKILVPYDGSDHAQAALKEAVDLASHGDDVTLVLGIVCAVPVGGPDPVTAMGQDLLDEVHERNEAILQSGLKQIPEGIHAVARHSEGTPGPALADMVKKEGCDLIVVGSSEKGQLEEFFLGSVSKYLIRHSRCPIFIVR